MFEGADGDVLKNVLMEKINKNVHLENLGQDGETP